MRQDPLITFVYLFMSSYPKRMDKGVCHSGCRRWCTGRARLDVTEGHSTQSLADCLRHKFSVNEIPCQVRCRSGSGVRKCGRTGPGPDFGQSSIRQQFACRCVSLHSHAAGYWSTHVLMCQCIDLNYCFDACVARVAPSYLQISESDNSHS